MPAKRRDAAESRFKDTAAQSSGVLTGYQQSTSPINAAYLRRNLKAYKQYGFPQDLSKLAGMTDQAREHAAAVAVIKKFKASDSPGGAQKPPTGGGGVRNPGPKKPTGGGQKPRKPTGGGQPSGGRPKPPAPKPKPKPKPTGNDPFGNRIPTPSQSVMDRVKREKGEKAPPPAPKPKPPAGPPKKPDVPVAPPNRGPIRAL